MAAGCAFPHVGHVACPGFGANSVLQASQRCVGKSSSVRTVWAGAPAGAAGATGAAGGACGACGALAACGAAGAATGAAFRRGVGATCWSAPFTATCPQGSE